MTSAHPSVSSSATAGATANVPFSEFRAGLPFGRFRVIVNPALAQKYMKHRLFVVGISLVLLILGTVIGFSGYFWLGLPMVLSGVLLSRLVKAHAPKILLYLASHDPSVYRDAIEHEIMEVRFAR
jgi:hypothetical protein